MTAPQRYPDLSGLDSEPLPNFEPAPGALACAFGDMRLTISNVAVAQLAHTVKESFLAVRNGAEAGGLLIGGMVDDGKTIAVEDIIEIKTEYRYGPAFRLSPSDMGAAKQLIAGVQSRGTDVFLGFYRGQTRGVPGLRESDFEFLTAVEAVDTSFQQYFRVALLFTPFATGVPEVEVLGRDGNNWKHITRRRLATAGSGSGHATPPVVDDDFLEADAPAPIEGTPDDTAAVAAGPEPSSAVAASVRRRPGKGILFSVIAFLAVVAGVAAGGWWGFSRRAPEAGAPGGPTVPPARERLGFAAAKEAGDWKLTWNPEATTRLAQGGADLVIRDGDGERLSALTPEDLATGTVFYTPRGNDIVFMLRAKTPGRPDIEERIRVLGAAPPAASPAAQGTLRLRPVTPAAPSVVTGESPVRRAFVPPPAQPEPPTNAEPLGLPAPPQMEKSEPSTAKSPIAPSPIAPSLIAGVPVVNPAPPTAAPQRGVETVLTPPVAIHQEQPHWPRFAPHTGTYEVQVRASIDANGNLLRAIPIQRNPANAPFMESAVQAVQFWKFRPAQAGGRAVPGEIVLTFRFRQ